MFELRSGYPSYRGLKLFFTFMLPIFYFQTSQNTIFIGWSCDVVATTHPTAAGSVTFSLLSRLLCIFPPGSVPQYGTDCI